MTLPLGEIQPQGCLDVISALGLQLAVCCKCVCVTSHMHLVLVVMVLVVMNVDVESGACCTIHCRSSAVPHRMQQHSLTDSLRTCANIEHNLALRI